MSSGPSDDTKQIRTLQFHALVTIDENDQPFGEASTDVNAVLDDGYLTKGFQCFSKSGYGIARVCFEVEVPDKVMCFKPEMFPARLVESQVIEGSSLDIPEVTPEESEPAFPLFPYPGLNETVFLPPDDVEDPPLVEEEKSPTFIQERSDNIFDDDEPDSLDDDDEEQIADSQDEKDKVKKKVVKEEIDKEIDDEFDINIEW